MGVVVAGLHVGRVERLQAEGPYPEVFLTATRKVSVEGAVHVFRDHLDGDEQADLRNHGGPDKAVLCYALGHYAAWREELDLPEMGPGGFGENLTLSCAEEDVAIGDRLLVGSALCEVSQPRVPCWKQAARWQRPQLVGRMQQTGRTGWYLRVVAEGEVWLGAEVHLVARPWPDYTVARCNCALHAGQGPDELRRVAACPALAPALRAALERRLSR